MVIRLFVGKGLVDIPRLPHPKRARCLLSKSFCEVRSWELGRKVLFPTLGRTLWLQSKIHARTPISKQELFFASKFHPGDTAAVSVEARGCTVAALLCARWARKKESTARRPRKLDRGRHVPAPRGRTSDAVFQELPRRSPPHHAYATGPTMSGVSSPLRDLQGRRRVLFLTAEVDAGCSGAWVRGRICDKLRRHNCVLLSAEPGVAAQLARGNMPPLLRFFCCAF